VFNSPFSNSRSVAEMTIANIINLARQSGDRNSEMHQGVWNKVSNGCFEIRGKKLGTLVLLAIHFNAKALLDTAISDRNCRCWPRPWA
jgi:lactate dehydrogenase-like 2-hydroxyacid dehydrogenase